MADALPAPKGKKVVKVSELIEASVYKRGDKKRLSKLERIAYHEAGHTVASYLVHRRFTGVTIIPDENYLGHCKQALVPTFAPDVDAVTTHKRTRMRHQIEKRIMVDIAGLLAERLATGRTNWKGGHEDIHRAVDLSTYVCGDIEESSAYVRWLWERTRLLLSFGPNWAALQAIAKELMKKRRIGERSARKIIGETMRAWRKQELERVEP